MTLPALPAIVPEPLGGSPLARAAADPSCPWFARRPASPEAWCVHAEQVRRDFAGTAWRDRLGDALHADGAAGERLARVLAGDGLVVTTGQQAGLFGGPLYTLYKALTARVLADELEAVTGRPVLPVFWAATDDADYEEARTVHVALAGGAVALGLPPVHEADGRAMREVPLPDTAALWGLLARAAGSGSDGEAFAALRDAYAPGATIGGAYVAWLRALLAPLGIAVLDAFAAGTCAAADPLLRRALAHAAPLADALERRGDALRAAGHEPQVADVGTLSLVWSWSQRPRRRLTVGEAAQAAATAAPGTLSATVLLRPVVERQLLPTAAYVAGPGELAYFAQVSAVAETLGVATPLAVPRWSGLLVEPHVQRLLDRLGLDLATARDPHGAARRLADAAMPAAARAAIDRLHADVRECFAALRAAGVALPRPALDGAEHQVLHKLERFERRLRASVKRSDEGRRQDLGTVLGALAPGGRPQERMLAFAPFVVRYGAPLLDALRTAMAPHAAALVGTEAPAARA
jgi:bacillithiol biosynthesis cysteine-adding enzyme BshC